MTRNQKSAITIMIVYTIAMGAVIATMRWWFVSATIYVAVCYLLERYYHTFKFENTSEIRARFIIWFWWLSIPFLAFQIYDQDNDQEENR